MTNRERIVEPIRVALLSTHSCPWARPGNRYTGGMNIYIQNLARELALRGHLVDIYTSSHVGDKLCRDLKLDKGVRLIHVNAPDYSSISEVNLDKHVSDIAASISSYCASHSLQYDLIHSHYWLSGLIGNILKMQWGIPHMTMFHTLAALKNGAGIGVLEPEYRIRYEKTIVNSCDLVIASTAKEKRELVDRYGAVPGKVSVIPCGINAALFRPIDKQAARDACNLDSKPTIVFVGRMDPLKGLSNLLDAVSILRSRKEFQLLVIGGDSENEPEFQHMLRLINDYHIEDSVIPIGSVQHEKMYLYYNAADFCVIPSYYESFSLVALESLACGTSVVSTDVGEVRDMARIYPGCKITPDNSPVTLASHMESMLDDPGPAGDVRELTTFYGWDSVSERITLEYANLRVPSIRNLESALRI
jgi:D-inositol-3-phosphate glycosyltransferase